MSPSTPGDPPQWADRLAEPGDGLIVVDPETANILAVDDTVCELCDYRRSDLVGTAVTEITAFDSVDGWRRHLPDPEDAAQQRTQALLCPDGREVPVETTSVVVEPGDRAMVITTVSDASGKRDSAEGYSTALLDAVMEAALDGLLVVDEDRNVVSYNGRFLELWDIPAALMKDSAGGHPLEQVRHELADPDSFSETVQSLSDQPRAELRDEIRLEDGRIFDLFSAPVVDADGATDGRLWRFRDVTGQRTDERRLERSRERLRQVIDLVPDLIFVKNSDGEYVLVNQAVAEAFGRPVEEIEGRTDRELLPDGEEMESFRADDVDVILSGEPKHVSEEHLTTADGRTLLLETRKIPFRVRDGGTAVLGYARDVTALKDREARLQRQRDDLRVLNEILRHDVRNDLQLVVSYAELLEASVTGEASTHLSKIERSAQSAVELTETAGNLAETLLRTGDGSQSVTLRPPLVSTLENVRSKYDVATVDIQGSIPTVSVAANDMLKGVFRNVLSNAIEHNDSAHPEVQVSVESHEDRVLVSIADNGPGIPDDRKAAIFGKGEQRIDSQGTGLGLYLVNTLVTDYGGDVWVEDNDPEGSIFKIELPRTG